MKNDFVEKVDNYIRTNYKDDIKKLNGLMCLLKSNIDNISNITKIDDFQIKYKQSKGYEEELLKVINICKNNTTS